MKDESLEDSTQWKRNYVSRLTEKAGMIGRVNCVKCGRVVLKFHCSNLGCGYCSACGEQAKVDKR